MNSLEIWSNRSEWWNRCDWLIDESIDISVFSSILNVTEIINIIIQLCRNRESGNKWETVWMVVLLESMKIWKDK